MGALALLLLACASEHDHPGPGTLRTEAGLYDVTWAPTPYPMPLNELFVVDCTVADPKTGAPLPSATVAVDARMPDHGHGMTTKPITTLADGRSRTEGMKLHMPGHWTFDFKVTGPAGEDRVSIVVDR